MPHHGEYKCPNCGNSFGVIVHYSTFLVSSIKCSQLLGGCGRRDTGQQADLERAWNRRYVQGTTSNRTTKDL